MNQLSDKPLTKRQQEIFDFILECMAAADGSSHADGSSNVIGIEQPELSSNNQDFHENNMAIIGDVAAGAPIFAAQHVQQYVSVDQSLFADKADFLLKVRGDSMINVGIFEQDLLAIKKVDSARDNEIIVARIEDDVTVKRYYRNGSQVSLVAENDDYAPIEVDLQTQAFAIEGVVVGLIRQGL